MKKKLLCILLLLQIGFAYSQYTVNGLSTQTDRLAAKKTLLQPTGCGVPNSTAFLNGPDLGMAASYYDSCGHKAYIYDPKNKTWSTYTTTETDPLFTASPAQSITTGYISNWNTAYGWGNHAGLYITIGDSVDFKRKKDTISLTGYLPLWKNGLNEKLEHKNQNGGYAGLDPAGKIYAAQLPNTVLNYIDTWAADDNIPYLANGIGNKGDVYQISNNHDHPYTGNRFGATDDFWDSDFILYNGSTWSVSAGSLAVRKVNGKQGIVTLNTDDLSDAGKTNKFYASSLFNTDFSSKTTDNLTQGTTNKYYSDALVNTLLNNYTGDVTFSSGVSSIGANKVTNTMINSVNWSKITSAPSFISSAAISSLTDVSLALLATGHFLRYNGTAWANTLLVTGDIPNLDWSKITSGKPTTLSGYGISDAVTTGTTQSINGSKTFTGSNGVISNYFTANGTAGTGYYKMNTQSSKPTNPTSSAILYADAANLPRALNTDGSTNILADNTVSTITYAASITNDLGSVLAKSQVLTLNGNVTSITLSNPVKNGFYTFKIIQDGTGGRTITGWPGAVKWPSGLAPTLTTTAGAVDIISLWYDGTNFNAVYNYDFR